MAKASQSASSSSSALPPAPKVSFWSFLPPWIATNVRSPKSRKMLFRCWLASWAAFIFILPNHTLSVMGNAAFFGFLASMFLPPYIPIQLFIIAISTLLIGVLAGWGIGAAAMRASLAVRNQVLLQANLEKAHTIANGSSNPEGVFRVEIFNGDFLDFRSTLMFGGFLAFGTFMFGLLRAYSRPLVFMSIFGTIAVDIFCTIGPLFPFGQYYLLNTLLIPISMYMAIACVLIVFVFPETVNHAFLDTAAALLGKIEFMVQAQEVVLTTKMENLGPDNEMVGKLRATRGAMFTVFEGLSLQSKFINIEFSFGRWNGDDAKGLVDPFLGVISRINALTSFLKYVAQSAAVDVMGETSALLPEDAESKSSKDTYLIQQVYKHNHIGEKELCLRLIDVLPILKEATADVRQAVVEGAVATREMIQHLNHNRYTWLKSKLGAKPGPTLASHEEALDRAVEHLRTSIAEFKADKRLRLLDPYLPHLSSAKTKEAQAGLPLRGLYISYVFSATLLGVADAILVLMELVRDTNAKRHRNRLWAPSGLRHVAHALFMEKRQGNDGREFGEQDSVQEVVTEEEDHPFRRDPDSQPPTNVFQRLMHLLHRLFQWLGTAEALFVFRYVLISILLWMPAVFKTSASFYYRQKGVWALIMAQTTLTIYAGDQLYNYVIRLAGTFVGLIYGLIIWYAGNGSGNGNRYGFAASVAVFLVPLQFVRLFAPPQYLQGVVLMAATVVLIQGYSWIDGHLPVISDPGEGWSVAWRRWTLVVIGSAASFILMMLPAKSGRKAVRLHNATTLTGLSNIYASLMSTWITNDPDPAAGEKGSAKLQSPQWVGAFRAEMVKVALQIQSVKEQAQLARWEGNIRGRWPHEEYDRMGLLQEQMVAVMSQLGGALVKLDPGWRMAFLHNTKVVNPNFITEVMSIFALVSQSLRTGEPIHTALPQNLLDRLLYHHTSVYLDPNAEGIIRLEEIQALDYLYYAAAVIAVFQLMEILDELQAITRRLCGEVPFKGFDRWRDEHQRAHPIPGT